MSDDAPSLDDALAEAHLPALVASLVHLSGDASLVGRDRWPMYDPFGEARTGGYSETMQAEIRSRAKAALTAYAAGAPLAPIPSSPTGPSRR